MGGGTNPSFTHSPYCTYCTVCRRSVVPVRRPSSSVDQSGHVSHTPTRHTSLRLQVQGVSVHQRTVSQVQGVLVHQSNCICIRIRITEGLDIQSIYGFTRYPISIFLRLVTGIPIVYQYYTNTIPYNHTCFKACAARLRVQPVRVFDEPIASR
jgi:hypothetical protein